MNRPTLGVALITRDAAYRLRDCLEAIRFADAIVVLDSGSTDQTVAIARACGARVEIDTDWQGFGIQKNRAVAHLEQLQTDWILLIDADEIVSPELAASIVATLSSPAANQPGAPVAYSVNRLSSFCGRWIRHSGWFPDPIPRLFKRGSARFSDDRVHERLLFTGTAPSLAGLLHHYSYEDVGTVLRKLDAYSAAGAQQRFERGARASLGKAIGRGLWAFVRTYFLKRGFLDGAAGFMIAVFNAETVYYRFLRVAELGERAHAASAPPSTPPSAPPDSSS